MTATLPDLVGRYAESLEQHLAGPGEPQLSRAYDFGRGALNAGLGALDVAALHHSALAGVLFGRGGAAQGQLARASEFLCESLAPFDMALRGYQDSNAQLAAGNRALEQANAALREARARLEREAEERHRTEQALQESQKLQAIGQLAGGIAHDFNNLITVILGKIEVAGRYAAVDPGLERVLSSIRQAAERGAKVTNQLLAFSRRQLLQPAVLELSERLHGLVSLLTGSLRRDIVIDQAIPADLWPVEIDPTQLELALVNLALNARDAMPNGGTLRIGAANRRVRDKRLDLDGAYVVLQMEDDGEGIPPEILPRVVEPFFTTKGAGRGLGLSQVHGFVHQSAGAMDIESTPGQGTVVRLYLPAQPVMTDAAGGRSGETTASAGPTVLVVDDEEAVAEVAAELLMQAGYQARVAHRGQAALEMLQRGEKVDIVFSDIVMPDGLNGFELAAQLRKLAPHIPVLLTTGYIDVLMRRDAGDLAILKKPYRGDDLCNSVESLLHSRRAGTRPDPRAS